MLSVQSVLSFVLGFAAAVFIAALFGKIIWRRMMYLARRAAEREAPSSLEEAEAEFNAGRARHAAELCRAEDALERERQAGHERQLALSTARERLSEADRLEKQCAAQARRIDALEKKLARLSAQNEKLKEKAKESVRLKAAELAEFRRQIKQIAAQTAGFIAAREGADSPVLRIIAADAGADAESGKNDLAAAITEQARNAAIIRKAKTDK